MFEKGECLCFEHPFQIIMAIVAIVAVAQNLAIGKDGRLPWHYRSDLKFFKQSTTNNAILMGWNTWLSIGKPLPNRLNVVLSRSRQLEHQPSLLLMRSREEVLELMKYLNCDLFITGGAEIYGLFKSDIDKWLVTEIPQTIAGADTFMPADFLENFGLSGEQNLADDLKVKVYERNK